MVLRLKVLVVGARVVHPMALHAHGGWGSDGKGQGKGGKDKGKRK